ICIFVSARHSLPWPIARSPPKPDRVPLLSTAAHRIAAIPWIYDAIQITLGLQRIQARIAPHIARMNEGIVLDVGAGTGLARPLVPVSSRYVWLDVDPKKLSGFRAKQTAPADMVLADAVRLSLLDQSVDYALCLAISHHLSDSQLRQLFSEMARVVRREI